MKKIFSILCLMLFVVVSLGSLTGCEQKVDSITINAENKPQATMVIGQEISLDNEIDVTIKDKVETINFGSEGVSIKGYDKEKLGAQTVVVEYKGCQASFNVTVVPRMIISGATTDYFVGESFNKDNGTLKVTADDGSFTTVQMSDDNVTVDGFDSTKPQTNTVTFKYNNYTQDFNVNINDISKVTITNPRKLIYESYETEFDVTGGYITLTNEKSGLSRSVVITKDMVTGFDISAVSKDTREVTQKITVTYLGESKDITVTLKYSEVTTIIEMLEDLEEVDWNGDSFPEITDKQGETATNALALYEELSASEKKVLDKESVNKIICTTMHYNYIKWVEAIGVYKETLSLTTQGLFYTLNSYEGVKKDALLLADENNEFYVLTDYIEYLLEEYSDTELGEVTIKDCYKVFYTSDVFQSITPVLENILSIHESMSDIPDEWTTETLSTYKDSINEAYQSIIDGISNKTTSRTLLNFMTKWRTNTDTIDILYDYYYNLETDLSENKEIGTLVSIIYPSQLEEIFNTLQTSYNSFMNIYSCASGYQQGYYDNTGAVYFYYKSAELINEMFEEENELYIAIFSQATIAEFKTSMYGLFTQISSINETFTGGKIKYSPEYFEFWDIYLDIYENCIEGDFTKVPELLDLFMSFTPAVQNGIYSSITMFYGKNISSVFNTKGMALCDMVYGYFIEELEGFEGTDFDAVSKMLIAFEYYSTYAVYPGKTDKELTSFTDLLFEIKLAYDMLDSKKQEKFNTVCGPMYTYLKNIEKYETKTEEVNLGDSTKDIEELEASLNRLLVIYNYINIKDELGNPNANLQYYLLYMSEYEKAYDIYNSLLTNEEISQDIKNYLMYELTMFDNEDGKKMLTFDAAVMFLRSMYTNILSIEVVEGFTVINGYSTKDMNLYKFIMGSNKLLWSYFSGAKFEDGKTFEEYLGFGKDTDISAKKEDVINAFALYKNLTAEEQYTLMTLDRTNMFGSTVYGYFNKQTEDENTLAAVEKLLMTMRLAVINDVTGGEASYEDEDGNTVYYSDLVKEGLEDFNELYVLLIDADKALIDEVLSDLLIILNNSATSNSSGTVN